MAPHSSTLAWKIPWMEEPGRLPVHGIARSQTWLSGFTVTFHFHALEKEMATHSSVLAWRIPGTGEPGGMPAMGLHRVGHDWRNLAAAAAAAAAEPSGMHLLPVDTQICWMSGMLAPLWPMPALLVYPLRSLTPPPKAAPHHKCSPASHSPRVISSTLKVSTLTCTPKFTSNLVSLRNLSPWGIFTFLVPSLDQLHTLALHVRTPHTICVRFRQHSTQQPRLE